MNTISPMIEFAHREIWTPIIRNNEMCVDMHSGHIVYKFSIKWTCFVYMLQFLRSVFVSKNSKRDLILSSKVRNYKRERAKKRLLYCTYLEILQTIVRLVYAFYKTIFLRRRVCKRKKNYSYIFCKNEFILYTKYLSIEYDLRRRTYVYTQHVNIDDYTDEWVRHIKGACN